MNLDEQKSRIKLLIAKGKEQGYLTYSEVNDHLLDGIVDPEQIEDIVSMINDMGITVHEVAPDTDALLMMETTANTTDEDAAEEAAAALASLDTEFGRTTDPVRMYMREMGTVDLLTREGEIKIAKRIEEGLKEVYAALAQYPPTIGTLLERYAKIKREEGRLGDILTGFWDADQEENKELSESISRVLGLEKDNAGEDADADADEEINKGPDPERATETTANE